MYYLLVLIVCLLSYNGQDQDKSASHKNKSDTSTQNTPAPTPSIQPISSAQGQEPANGKKGTPQNDSASWFKPEWWMVILTAIYVVLTGVYVCFSGSTLKAILRQEKDSAKQFTKEIAQLTKSSNAMEDIARRIERGNIDITRAYLVVVIGAAIFQQKREGLDDLLFEANPLLINTGSTPARKVCIRIAADILPIPIPEDFTFPLPEAEIKDAGIVGPHQQYGLAKTLDRSVPYADVQTIKEGKERALCVWGLITYEDMYGKPHSTKFGQWITWWPNGKVFGYYLAGQNDFD